MGRSFESYLAMKTNSAAGNASEAATALINSDLRDLGAAVQKLASDALVLGSDLGSVTVLLKWLAFFAAVSVFITVLLVAHFFLRFASLRSHSVLFSPAKATS